jgi:hypothetical protein
VIGGVISGYVSGGDLKSALIGGLMAFAFTEIHALKDIGLIERAGLHGLVGGLASEAQDGNFVSGFLAAGFGALVAPVVGNQFSFKGVIVSAIAGGIGAVLGGGKFENGAITSAFGYLFNESLVEDYNYKLTAVAFLHSPDDPVGHAFVILETPDGEQIARGWYPAHDLNIKESWNVMGDIMFIAGDTVAGILKDDAMLLARFNTYQKFGYDGLGGMFASRTYALNYFGYHDAMSAMQNWQTTKMYSNIDMCGMMVRTVVQASTGYEIGRGVQTEVLALRLGGGGPMSYQIRQSFPSSPRVLYGEFGGR